MYELAAADLERLAGWPAEAGRFAGGIAAPWPPDRLAIELALAPSETNPKTRSPEVLAVARRLIPWLAHRLAPPEVANGPAIVLRLDGRFGPGGISSVLHHLDPTHTSLFRVTAAERLSAAEPLPAASLSMLAGTDVLSAIAADTTLLLAGGLRLRVFAVPRELAPVLISCEGLDDERFASLLPQVSLFLAPAASLQSVFLVGPATALDLRQRLGVGQVAPG